MTKKTQPQFRSAYNAGTKNYGITATDGITEQHHAKSCDINLILAQFMDTGIMPQTKLNPQHADVSQHNFQDAQNQIALAKTLFEELPEHVRNKFENQPYKFLQFAEDENNYDQMIEMGLINAPHPEDNALQTDEKGSPFLSGKDEVAPSQEAPQGDS